MRGAVSSKTAWTVPSSLAAVVMPLCSCPWTLLYPADIRFWWTCNYGPSPISAFCSLSGSFALRCSEQWKSRHSCSSARHEDKVERSMAPLIFNLGYRWGESSGSSLGRFAPYPLYSSVYDSNSYKYVQDMLGARGGAVSWSTALKAGRPRVLFLMGVIGIFSFSGRTMAPASTQPLTDISGGKGGPCLRLTTLPPSCASWLEIVAASTSWSPTGLSRPV
jgi:hypothetical protein